MDFRFDKDEMLTWIAALRSGEYSQTQHTLNDSAGFCCLGVACKILIPANFQRLNIDYETGESFIDGDTPESQRACPTWLANVDDDFMRRTTAALSSLNDLTDKAREYVDSSLTFDEIADLLELVYIHRALDEVV